jgi:hypothetical protein
VIFQLLSELTDLKTEKGLRKQIVGQMRARAEKSWGDNQMTSVKELQTLVDRMRDRTMPIVQVRRMLHHESPLVRVNALEACVDAARHDEDLLEEFTMAVSNPANKVRMMGTVSVAHIAVGCLLRVGTNEAIEAAKALLQGWPEPDRDQLVRYLESEGLAMD